MTQHRTRERIRCDIMTSLEHTVRDGRERSGLADGWFAEIGRLATADAQAEIKRLSEELAREEKAQCEIIKERDDAEDALSKMYQSVMGEPPEWSSGFGFEAAISDTEEYVQALRQRARAIAMQPVYQYRVGSYWMDTTKIFFDARVQAGQETRTLHKEIQPPSGRTEGQGDE